MDARPSEQKTPFNLVRLRPVWYAISTIAIIAGIVGLATRGLNLGTDFTGGAEIQYETSQPLPESDADRANLVDDITTHLGLGTGAVKAIVVSDDPLIRELLVRYPVETQGELEQRQMEIEQQLEAQFGDRLGDVEPTKDATFIGPVIGSELRTQAILCLVIGLSAILIFIWQRYNIKMAATGIAALAHDVLILVGAMALGGWEINAPFVAAVLTVVGFSINDSVIIFDRIRENMQSRTAQRQSFGDVVNVALWETMPRSINTTMTVIVVLLALLLLGGSTLHEFTIALLIGMACGAYSSIFTASQLIVSWDQWEKSRQTGKTAAAVTGRPRKSAKRQRQTELERARSAAEEVAQSQPATATAEGPPAADAPGGGSTKDRAQASKAAKAKDKSKRKGKSRRRH